MTLTIEIQNWKHIPHELAANFVLGKIQEKINNGEFALRMFGKHYEQNGIEYSVSIKL